MSLNPDGSQDSQIKIKDLEGIKVGDWELLVDITQEEDAENAISEAILDTEKAPKPLTINSDGDRDDDQDGDSINITKSSLRLRKPVKNQYYTAEEAEAGDPMVVDNPKDVTTDSGSGTEVDADDSDDSFNADEDNGAIEDHIME